MMISSTSSAGTLTFSRTAFMHVAASCGAATVESAPPSAPIGVRTPATKKASLFMSVSKILLTNKGWLSTPSLATSGCSFRRQLCPFAQRILQLFRLQFAGFPKNLEALATKGLAALCVFLRIQRLRDAERFLERVQRQAILFISNLAVL